MNETEEIIIDIKPNFVLSEQTIRLRCAEIAASITKSDLNHKIQSERFESLCNCIYEWVLNGKAE